MSSNMIGLLENAYNSLPECNPNAMAPDRPPQQMPDPTRWLNSGTPAAPGSAEDSRDTEFSPVRMMLAAPPLVNPEHDLYPYSAYLIRCEIRHKTGIDSAPTARSLSTAQNAFWRRDGGEGKLIVRWKAERVGQMPVLPHWELQDPMYTLVYKRISPREPILTRDGRTYKFQVAGKYIYHMKAPPGENFNYPVGVTRVHLINPAVITLTGTMNFSREPLAFLSGQYPPEGNYNLNT